MRQSLASFRIHCFSKVINIPSLPVESDLYHITKITHRLCNGASLESVMGSQWLSMFLSTQNDEGERVHDLSTSRAAGYCISASSMEIIGFQVMISTLQ